ncbi:hypothetical protein UlMin_027218 [Ulmus minor]
MEFFFFKLCDRLRRYGLISSKGVQLEELIGLFLMILGHAVGIRVIKEQFQHLGKIVSRKFHFALEKMMMLAFDEIKPPENYNDYIGAIDETHIHAKIHLNEQIPYIGRKGFPTQNSMAICDFNMREVLTIHIYSWRHYEILILSFPNHHLLYKYYLVDAGYPNMKGYLAPYKGERYYLPVFHSSDQPKGERETFTYVHSSLRSVIERCFGVWKARWQILADMPRYKFDSPVAIVMISMALHNFIRRDVVAGIEFESHEENEDYVQDDDESYINPTIDDNEMRVVCDKITREFVL